MYVDFFAIEKALDYFVFILLQVIVEFLLSKCFYHHSIKLK